MSRGPGHIERTIKELFVAEPDAAFTTEQLCRKVYPRIRHVLKKHRVAVLRAAKKLQLHWKMSEGGPGRTLTFSVAGSRVLPDVRKKPPIIVRRR